MPEQSPVDGRREEIYRWVGQRLEIEIHEPTPEEPHYRAVVGEFGLVGDGDTFDTAFDAVMDRVADLLDDYSTVPIRYRIGTNRPPHRPMRRIVEMDDAGIIANIRVAVEVGDFEYDRAHCDYHMGREGFTLDEAVRAVMAGDVIESSPGRNRWLFCDTVGTLRSIRSTVGVGCTYRSSTTNRTCSS